MKPSNPSRTTLLEGRVKHLEGLVNSLLLVTGAQDISTEESEEEKKARALKEKGVVKYGDD